MSCNDTIVARRHAGRTGPHGFPWWRGALIAGLAAALGGCHVTTTAKDTTGSIPVDYQDRHPIAVKEGEKTLVVFVGAGRGGLSPTQRAEVLSFGRSWRSLATGGVTVERPIGGGNERAAGDTLKETLSILAQAGVPRHGVAVRTYRAPYGQLAPLRLGYPKIVAEAGPCGLWPDDLGPSYQTKHFKNRQYYNFGCASQRNLAAMVAEPADLVQPRGETPVYTAKRTTGMTKWQRGENPATNYPDAKKGQISQVGQ